MHQHVKTFLLCEQFKRKTQIQTFYQIQSLFNWIKKNNHIAEIIPNMLHVSLWYKIEHILDFLKYFSWRYQPQF